MENPQVEKKTKSTSKSASYATLRVKKVTRKRVMEFLQKANRKDWGKRVKADDLILLAINRVTDNDIAKLQQESMTHADRFEAAYNEYISQNGPMPKDEYLGKRLNGEISAHQHTQIEAAVGTPALQQ